MCLYCWLFRRLVGWLVLEKMARPTNFLIPAWCEKKIWLVLNIIAVGGLAMQGARLRRVATTTVALFFISDEKPRLYRSTHSLIEGPAAAPHSSQDAVIVVRSLFCCDQDTAVFCTRFRQGSIYNCALVLVSRGRGRLSSGCVRYPRNKSRRRLDVSVVVWFGTFLCQELSYDLEGSTIA